MTLFVCGCGPREADRRRLQDDVLLVQDEIAAHRPTVFTADEVTAIVKELRIQRDREDAVELRAIRPLVVDRVTVTGKTWQVQGKPEARPWFAV